MSKQIITSLLDNDLYTFSVCFFYLNKFPRAEGVYDFIDRNKTKYPKNFADKVNEQIKLMENISITDDEIDFMEKKCYYIPKWFFTFLKGYRFDSNEIHASQDVEGHLSIKVIGKLWKTVFWEVPILAMVSELYHNELGDFDNYNYDSEYQKSYDKISKLSENGVRFMEFGSRRRGRKMHQQMVLKSFDDYTKNNPTKSTLLGTSNVYFAKMFNMNVLGTMSHQVISAVASFYGPLEANNTTMNLWEDVYGSDLGTYLYDTFTRKVFLENFSLKNAKLFTGLRVDSGDNFEAFEDIKSKYDSFDIDPKIKGIVFSNALDVDSAIDLHKKINGEMNDSYGIGTKLSCDIDGVKPSNMVIKLTSARITEKREFRDCIKMSDDYGKFTGNPKTFELYKSILGIN